VFFQPTLQVMGKRICCSRQCGATPWLGMKIFIPAAHPGTVKVQMAIDVFPVPLVPSHKITMTTVVSCARLVCTMLKLDWTNHATPIAPRVNTVLQKVYPPRTTVPCAHEVRRRLQVVCLRSMHATHARAVRIPMPLVLPNARLAELANGATNPVYLHKTDAMIAKLDVIRSQQ